MPPCWPLPPRRASRNTPWWKSSPSKTSFNPMKNYPLYLNGEFVTTGTSISVRNPGTAENFAEISTCGRDRVNQALRDAHTAFASWRNVVAKTRADYLHKISAEIEKRSD